MCVHPVHLVQSLASVFQISRRKSKRNGFGWVRAEVLGALVNGVFLLAMCFTISLESIGRLIHPRRISHPLQVLIVGCIGLLINVIGIGLFHGGHGHTHGGGGGHGHSHGEKSAKKNTHEDSCDKNSNVKPEHDHDDFDIDSDSDAAIANRPGRSRSRIGQDCSHNLSLIVGSGSKQHLALKLVNLDENAEFEEFTDSEAAKRKQKQAGSLLDAENLNMRGVFLHIMSDAIGSVFVIITASLALFFPNALGRLNDYLDPALSLTLVTLICFSAYALVRETAGIILRRTPAFLDFDDINSDIMKIRGVAAVRSTCAWTLVGNRHLATAEVNLIEFCTPAAFDAAAPKIRKVFHRHGIHSLTMQPIFSSPICAAEMQPNHTLDAIKEDVSDSLDTVSSVVHSVKLWWYGLSKNCSNFSIFQPLLEKTQH
ncbi:cation diffusion facilitator family transporter [Ancylostoma duodenale]|uniref:Cation diffusion facilitator family transporter n=1 Tax=Ancylostoma duodenale TaxID=51022 RepID=A0A0C2DJP8_9BILA|nr:cation diffusion facilitator family transporter [Ancylostoma duodenale]